MPEKMIEFEGVSFTYSDGQHHVKAIDDLSVEIKQGEHLAVIGHNGSGKSTFARLCNALELPDKGVIYVQGLTADSMEHIYDIRKTCGMVFQNPDDQIVASTLEEDVAFGPENLGLSTSEIRQRVDDALSKVGLLDQATRSPLNLSGGQKQKLSIAGILALQPQCIILDEATAMLDPQSSIDLMQFIIDLCKQQNLTLINITHNMEEVLLADKVLALKDGALLLHGTPEEIFAQADLIAKEALRLPFHLSLFDSLAEYFTPEERAENFQETEVVELISRKIRTLPDDFHADTKMENAKNLSTGQGKPLIEIEHLSYRYNPKSSNSHLALQDVSLEVFAGEKLLICGHTGSGKSTLIGHFNALNRPQTGSVKVMGLSASDNANIPEIRRSVGLVFQYPERQLFANTVREDIAFGPTRQGVSEEEIDKRIKEVQELLELSDELLERSPFELSGGQQRRVAIAGVLSMGPEILVLDEPAAGLDPESRESMLQLVERLSDQGKTIVMVTHNMDDVARLADRIVVLARGKVLQIGTPEEIFNHAEVLAKSSLNLPQSLHFSRALSQSSGCSFAFYDEEEAVNCLRPYLAAAKSLSEE
ncbi:MAG: energy-coupling factor transporter ATPase [Eubacteriales bacterium]|nr:energy-coupling factor transporter ATPase [Eubacteriales bacterium]